MTDGNINKQTVITPIGVQEIDVTTHLASTIPNRCMARIEWIGKSALIWKGFARNASNAARKYMKKNGLGAFLFFQHYNIRYITGTYGGMWQTFDKLFRYVLLAGAESDNYV